MSTAATAISLPATTTSARIYGKEAKYEFVKLIRTRAFSLATIGFPVMFYSRAAYTSQNICSPDTPASVSSAPHSSA
jgi:hypothetical protein